MKASEALKMTRKPLYDQLMDRILFRAEEGEKYFIWCDKIGQETIDRLIKDGYSIEQNETEDITQYRIDWSIPTA